MEELQRACFYLREAGIDHALLSSHESIAYTSGFDVPLPIGAPTDFSGGYPLALVLVNAVDETAILICTETFRRLAEAESYLPNRLYFQYFDSFARLDAAAGYIACVKEAFAQAGVGRSVGVEYKTLPAMLLELMQNEGLKVLDAAPAMEKARWTKTRREIGLLLKSAQVADSGQSVLLKAAQGAGTNEFDIWADVFREMSREAGQSAVVSGEIVTGGRTGVVKYPGGPVDRVTQAGDTGIMDISVRVHGYWCDCCNTVVFGREAAKEQRHYYDISKGAFEAAVETLRPGARACDVYAAMQKVYDSYKLSVPHYGGHQIGTTVNENPRIVPYDTSPIEAGMIFCFEPGAYAGEAGTTGSRLEKMVLVEENGAMILNRFAFGLEKV